MKEEILKKLLITALISIMLPSSAHAFVDMYDDIAVEQTPEQKELENDPLQKELNKVLREGEVYVKKIHKLNDMILGDDVSQKMDKIEETLISIFDLLKNATKNGTLFTWAAIISVNLGFMNLIPLPALDGGRLAFMVYEGITRRKPNAKVENIIHSIGFILLYSQKANCLSNNNKSGFGIFIDTTKIIRT